jgi:hypothetical protein
VEFSAGRCELHTEEVLAVADQIGTVCFRKEGNGTDLNSAEHYIPHFILVTTLMSLHALSF